MDHVLASHLEDLTLLGSGDIGGTGNDLDNIVTGNDGNNLLSGGYGGVDTLIGGAGDDSVTFDVDSVASTTRNTSAFSNTYFFGSSGGKDTISFTNIATQGSAGKVDLTVALDSSFGAASTIKFNSDTSLINIGTGASIFVTGITGTVSSTNQAVSNLGFTLTTVSSSVITDLG